MTEILPSLGDLLHKGETLLNNAGGKDQDWPRYRASILYFERFACLADISIAEFEDRFPTKSALSPSIDGSIIISELTYQTARKVALRLISYIHPSHCQWAYVDRILRAHGNLNSANLIVPLAKRAKAEDLQPKDMNADWVWSKDYTIPQTSKQSWRRAICEFNRLFDNELVCSNAQLPEEPIAPRPLYDQWGNVRITLPNSLIHSNSRADYEKSFSLIWHGLYRAGYVAAADEPSPEDVLSSAFWSKIENLDHDFFGVKASSLKVYRDQAKMYLRAHPAIHGKLEI